MRLIDAEELKKWLERWKGYLDDDMIRRMQIRSKDIPTVEERKKGKWNWVSFNIECSECGAMPNFDSTEPLYNFCPNCGADMREGKTDAETS